MGFAVRVDPAAILVAAIRSLAPLSEEALDHPRPTAARQPAERRRELRASELERLRIGLGDRLTSVRASPFLGGIDTAASRLEAAGPDGNVRELVVRCYRGSEREREVERARRNQALLEAISIRLPFVPRPVLADPEGELLGEALIVLTWIPGSLSPRRRAAL